MNKEEAKKKQAELRCKVETCKDSIKYLNGKISELEAIINKPDRWQDSLVQPDKEDYFYLRNSSSEGLIVGWSSLNDRKPEYAFKTQEQAELIKEKMLLMQEMYAFAHVRNEGWMPDWESGAQTKHGILHIGDRIKVHWFIRDNPFVFGVVVKSMIIAEEMIEVFGERIEKFYKKQY